MATTVSARMLNNGRLREVSLDEALRPQQDDVVWVDVVGRDRDELEPLVKAFDLHPLAVEDALTAHQRPKLDDYGHHLFFVCYGLGQLPEEEDDEEIDVFIAPTFIVTVRDGTHAPLDPVLLRLEGPCPQGARAGWVAWAMLDEVVDNYFNIVDRLEDELDDLEDAVFYVPRPTDIQARIYRARKQLIRIRRRVTPMRDMLSSLVARQEISHAVVAYLQDVYDHVLRITDTIDTFRDLLASAHDTYLSDVSNDMNRVMKRFTSVGAILVFSTLVAGVYGMNFEHMPELHWRYGYPMALGLMVSSTVLLYWYFKRRDWL